MNRFAICQAGCHRQRWIAASLWIAAALAFTQTVAAQNPVHPKKPPVSRAPSKVRPDAARFRARVEAELREEHAERAHWGILVADRDTGEILYERNADHFFTPASNAKIFTTALALATLGPDYRFRTTLESKGALESDGRLAGDLILVGRGDPDLSNRKFPYAGKVERDGPADKALAELADTAIAKGLREVDGDIVADDSYLPYDPYPAGWNVGDLFFNFGAPIGAIALNDNIVAIEVLPGARAGEPATVRTEPGAALDGFAREITTGPPDGRPDFAVVRRPGLDFLLLRGTIPAGHRPIKLDFAMTAPAETSALALREILEARGVRVTGATRVQHGAPPETTAAGEPVVPPAPPLPAPNPLVLAEHVSPPLIESIRLTNKISQNLHAELFLRAVGREKTGLGSTAAGLKVERDFLKSAGIADGDVALFDGSGLSRDDLVTPRAVVTLLRYASRQPWGGEFMSTLPVAGMDGTLEDRMRNSAASGLLEAKTGAIEHVRALAGYATTLRGESLAFAIFCNNDPRRGPGATSALDAIATAMVETLGTAARPKKRK
jgi:D-alanyl-D-alanine carboxypeptidase/D-alanyl-D-alanine-endopeptidase (penicillin-binding protein 4)